MRNIQIVALIFFVVLVNFCGFAFAQNMEPTFRYARAEKPTPVLNTPDFRAVFGGPNHHTLALDEQGLIRAVEFIALPGTVFSIQNVISVGGVVIYEVNTLEYPSQKTGLYVDSRFVSVSEIPLTPRIKPLPPKQQILDRMVSHQGLPYVWGGNYSGGVGEMLQFYPPAKQLSRAEEERWVLYGLDCSGLLYEATNGNTPRNTSELIRFGEPVMIDGLSPDEIANQLLPLDLIVWKGHVIMVLDQHHTIESCLGCSPSGGVTIRKLRNVLQEVMSQRKPVNHYPYESGNEKYFVIRRWV